MGVDSKIGWCDHTFNPWIGCTHISPGCDHCYAERDNHFRKWIPEGWGEGKPRNLTSTKNWSLPARWNRVARHAGKPARVFCGSLCDVFDSEVPDEYRTQLFELIRETPYLIWMLLTKRHNSMQKFVTEWIKNNGGAPLRNVWLGVTAEDQIRADKRIPTLLKTPAVRRFVSIEPMLGMVDLLAVTHGDCVINAMTGDFQHINGTDGSGEALDWVIAGGESGPQARPMHPQWASRVRDRCVAGDIPFFFKQWGEWVHHQVGDWPKLPMKKWTALHFNGMTALNQDNPFNPFKAGHPYWIMMNRIGLKAAGNVIDGCVWEQIPTGEAVPC